jgi:hypothetical protein
MSLRSLSYAAAFLFTVSAAAQQLPIYVTDDFVDPRQHDRPVFASRLVVGAVSNFISDYRALHSDAAFVHFTNALYRKSWQFTYSHTEMRGEDPPPVYRCGCNPPLYFPTPPPPDATPTAPPLGSRDALQVAMYRQTGRGQVGPPIMLRYRLTFSRQQFDIPIRSATTNEVIDHRSGHEQSIGVDADTHFTFRGHDVWGSVQYARTSQGGTISNRSQQELAYTARPPAWAVGPVLVRGTLTVAGVTNRGGPAINVVNPAFEAFWHSHATGGNVHLVWSPQTTRDGIDRWRTRSQIAIFIDRGYVKLF